MTVVAPAPDGDTDTDGLPNGWESDYGLDPSTSDAGADPDGDGRTNLQEYQQGTHPRGFVITYFAEGATGSFFDTVIAVANPTATRALVLTRFQREDGAVDWPVLLRSWKRTAARRSWSSRSRGWHRRRSRR